MTTYDELSDRVDDLESRLSAIEGRSPDLVHELGVIIHGLLSDLFDVVETLDIELDADINARLDRLHQLAFLML
jgi:hypothetical protein